jgi:hypothetical protein
MELDRLFDGRRRSAIEVADIFVDRRQHAMEETERRPREAGGIEDRLARLVYLLPNALFVATGRHRLDWGDRHHPAIHYSGPNYWPTLAAAPPRPRSGDLRVEGYSSTQHQLSGLSQADADTYLRLRLTRRGEPAIP